MKDFEKRLYKYVKIPVLLYNENPNHVNPKMFNKKMYSFQMSTSESTLFGNKCS